MTSHNFKIGTELVEVDKPWLLRKKFSFPDSKWENQLKKIKLKPVLSRTHLTMKKTQKKINKLGKRAWNILRP